MKSIIKIILLAVVTGLMFTSCKKDKPDALPFYDTGSAPVLTASVGSVAPAPADSNSTVLSLTWTDPKYATDSNRVKYVIQIDSAGQNFDNPYTKQITATRSASFMAKDLNAVLVGFGFNFGVSYGVDIRVVSSYANNNDQKVSNTVTLQATPYVVPPKVQIPAARTLFLVGGATAGGWGNPVPTPAQQFTMIDTVTYEGVFYLSGGGQYLMLPVNGSWDEKYALDDNTVAGINQGGEFGYYSNANNTIYNDNFPGPSDNGMYKIRVDFQNGRFTVTPEKVFSLLRVAGDYQGWSPATAPALASPNADGVYEGYVNVPAGGTYAFKLTSQPDWGGTNYGNGGPGTLSTSGGDLVFPSGAGYYKINANTNNNTWSATPTTWGVVGSFTQWGSGPDIPLTYDAGSGSFTSAPVVITGNENFKFRANNDWPINLGDNGRDGSLEQDGGDMPITAGTYTFTLYLNNAGYYTYKVIRN